MMRPLIRDVREAVCEAFGVSDEVLNEKSAKHGDPFNHARQMAFFVARRATGRGFPMIGKAFARDHSTILYSCKRMAERVANDPDVAAEARRVRLLVNRRVRNRQREMAR